MIQVNNVTFKYKGSKTPVFQDYSLEIADGDFVVLYGNNASGKSTLAQLIAGVRRPHKGSVIINEIDTADRKRFRELRKEISIVFQNPENNLLFDRVFDDMAFGLTNLDIPKEKHLELIESALESVGMSGFEHASTFELSFGQKQRIAIAGVIAMGTKAIVLDEPTAMLDTQGKHDIYELLLNLNACGKTIILTTNIQEETAKGRVVKL